MSSNINPEMRGTIDIKPFKMWCQKVLPQVYDDSLSYYEVLGKLVVYLNEVIENVETDGENVLTLHQAFLDLQTYVNEFFDDIGQLPDYVEQARQYAVDSQDSATRSAQYASNSAASASNSADAALASANSAVSANQSKNNAATSEQNAASYMQNALNSAHDSEAWAVGTIGGVPVPPTNIHHENNSKWWASKSEEWYLQVKELIESLPENVDEILEMYQSLEPLKDSEELSDELVTFNSDFGGAPLKKIVVDIQAVQSGSGDPSPENVRPITGWTSAKITKSGKNLTNKLEWNKSSNNFWIGAENFNAFPDGSFILPQGTYTLSLSDSMNGIYINIGATAITRYATATVSFTVTEKSPAKLMLYKSNVSVDYWNTLNVQLELGSTATDYEQYKGETYDITFPTEAGTVCSGTITINADGSATLIVNEKKIVLNGTQQISIANWQPSQTSVGVLYPYSLTNNRVYSSSTAPQNIKSDKLKPVTYQEAYTSTVDNCITTVVTENVPTYGLAIRLSDITLTTPELINNYLSANPVEVCYELVTPITYTLSPELVNTLKGINNVWSNAGNVTVTIGGYIETITTNLANKIPTNILTSNIENSNTASKNYNANDFFVLNNTLYKVTTTIAQDGTIIPDTNVVKTTIMDEITALLNA